MVRDPDDPWTHAPWLPVDDWRKLWLLHFTEAELREAEERRERQREAGNFVLLILDQQRMQRHRQRHQIRTALRSRTHRQHVLAIQSSLASVLLSLDGVQEPHPLAAVLPSLASHTDSPAHDTWPEHHGEPMTADQEPHPLAAVLPSLASHTGNPTQETWSDHHGEPMIADCEMQ